MCVLLRALAWSWEAMGEEKEGMMVAKGLERDSLASDLKNCHLAWFLRGLPVH